MKMMRKIFGATILLTLFLLSGCASTPQKVKERYFWPPPPGEPKIEWIGTYSGQKDLSDNGVNGVLSFLVGEDVFKQLENPATIAADGNGRVFVSDLQNGVMVFDFNKNDVHSLGGNTSEFLFRQPSGIALDENGNIYVADLSEKKIYVFDKNERPLRSIDLSEKAKSVGYIAIDRERKRIVVPDVRGHKLLIVDYDGTTIKVIEAFKDNKDGFRFPSSAAIDPKGNILVADTMNARVVRFSPEGEFLSAFGQRGDNIGDFSMIKAVATDSEGHIYVTDAKSNKVQIYNEQGETLLAIGILSPGSGIIGGFYYPNGIYIDQNDVIHVVDKLGKRFHVFQYLNKAYLAIHPITKQTIAAKPEKGGEQKSGAEKKPPTATK